MSKRLYIVFKPSADLAIVDMVRKINERFPGTARISDDGIDIDDRWTGRLTQPSNRYEHPGFPYWNFYFYCYWDAISESADFRCYVMTLCEALGAAEWWYIEEESTDLYDELDSAEYEDVLAESVGIERFEVPTYFPAGECHFFRDSSLRVKSLMY